jgi:hypothetical protein
LGKDILDGIGVINAQLEVAESLLFSLRGHLLALETSPSPGSLWIWALHSSRAG